MIFRTRSVLISALAGALVACSSGGSGGGNPISCADGGACPAGFVCDTTGTCIALNTGGSSGGGGSGGAATGGGGSSATGGVATGGTSGGGSGGSGGSIVCPSNRLWSSCQEVSTGTGTCNLCTQQSCCAQIETCLADPVCTDLLECYLAYCGSKGLSCASTTCASCASALPLFKPISDCWLADCQSGCSFLQP